jgi:hypothetical protein
MTQPPQPDQPDPYQPYAPPPPPTSGPPAGYYQQPVSTPPAGYPGYPTSPGYPVTPYQPQYQQPQQVIVVQSPATSGWAVASLVLSILGLVFVCCTFGAFSILAVLTGHIGMMETRNGVRAGRGMAVAGLIMGYVVALPAIILTIQIGAAGVIGSFQPDPVPS